MQSELTKRVTGNNYTKSLFFSLFANIPHAQTLLIKLQVLSTSCGEYVLKMSPLMESKRPSRECHLSQNSSWSQTLFVVFLNKLNNHVREGRIIITVIQDASKPASMINVQATVNSVCFMFKFPLELVERSKSCDPDMERYCVCVLHSTRFIDSQTMAGCDVFHKPCQSIDYVLCWTLCMSPHSYDSWVCMFSAAMQLTQQHTASCKSGTNSRVVSCVLIGAIPQQICHKKAPKRHGTHPGAVESTFFPGVQNHNIHDECVIMDRWVSFTQYIQSCQCLSDMVPHRVYL